MSDLQVFTNKQFGEVRTIEENGNVLFCGADVARALGYSNTKDAIIRHCRGVVKHDLTDSIGRKQEAAFIPEPDLYRLIVKSKLPSAEQFERWVFDEVLPSIRKHGAYVTPAVAERMLNDPDVMIQVLQELKRERAERIAAQAANELNAPKVAFADAVKASSSAILVRDLAKLLRQNGVETGEKRLYQFMRDNGFIEKHRNAPMQRSMEMGLFEVKETTITHSDGTVIVKQTPMVTGKGQVYFINLLLRAGGAYAIHG